MKRIEWENYQDGDSTPLNAENLNLMQDNIEEAIDNIDISSELEDIETQINDLEEAIDKGLTYETAGELIQLKKDDENLYPIVKKNILTATTTYTSTSTSWTPIDVSEYDNIGNLLSIENGEIKITGDVTKIKASASFYGSDYTSDIGIGFSITHNGSRKLVHWNTTAGGNISAAIIPTLLSVKNGDTIGIQYRAGITNTKIRELYLTVEVV